MKQTFYLASCPQRGSKSTSTPALLPKQAEKFVPVMNKRTTSEVTMLKEPEDARLRDVLFRTRLRYHLAYLVLIKGEKRSCTDRNFATSADALVK